MISCNVSLQGIEFVDIWNYLYKQTGLFQNDGLHLSAVGVARFGRLISEAVWNFWAKNDAGVARYLDSRDMWSPLAFGQTYDSFSLGTIPTTATTVSLSLSDKAWEMGRDIIILGHRLAPSAPSLAISHWATYIIKQFINAFPDFCKWTLHKIVIFCNYKIWPITWTVIRIATGFLSHSESGLSLYNTCRHPATFH